MLKNNQSFEVKEKCLAYSNGQYYTANVLAVLPNNEYKIKYSKFAKPEILKQIEIVKCTPDNVAYMKKLVQDHIEGKHFMQLEVLAKEEASLKKSNNMKKKVVKEEDQNKVEEEIVKTKTPKKRGPKAKLSNEEEAPAFVKNDKLSKIDQLKINIPPPIQYMIFYDYQCTCVLNQKLSLPKPDALTVDSIVSLMNIKEGKAIISLFNKLLPLRLLFANEQDQNKSFEEYEPSSIYGVEHLARLLVRLPELMKELQMKLNIRIKITEIANMLLNKIAESKWEKDYGYEEIASKLN